MSNIFFDEDFLEEFFSRNIFLPGWECFNANFRGIFFWGIFFSVNFFGGFFSRNIFPPAGNVVMLIVEEYFFSDADIFSPRLGMFSCNIIMEYLLWECFNVIVRGICFFCDAQIFAQNIRFKNKKKILFFCH